MVFVKKFLVCLLIVSLFVGSLSVSALSVSAAAAVVLNAYTGEVLWAQNADKRLPMASTTKIMTALLLCESGELSRSIVITPEMVRVEGSSMGLLAGDSVTLHDLLYGMMLASGNDAANTVAMVLGGSIEGFADMMNKRASELGLENTHFVTPSGLDDEQHYTTARDLGCLAAAALKNSDFAAAAKAKTATLCYGNPPYKRTLTNHNRLLKTYDDIIGVKTGFTKRSGRCLVSAAERDGRRVIAVTLNDPNDWTDHRNMLDMGLSMVERVTLKPEPKVKPYVIGGVGEVELEVPTLELCVRAGEVPDSRVCIAKTVFAPVSIGETVGAVAYFSQDTVYKSEKITVKSSIKTKKEKKTAVLAAIFKIILKNTV